MLLVGLWQDTGDQNYKALADKLIADASRDVPNGGVVWRDDAGCWFSEYAYTGMSQSQEYYVLNGHLFALEAVRILAQATQDPTLADLYACGVRGTKSRSANFLIGNMWTLYMLQPGTIDQMHYSIFESMQFDALHALDPDPFFAEQAETRRALFKRYFPAYLLSDGNTKSLFVAAVGAPHPYSLNTYALELGCKDASASQTAQMPNPYGSTAPMAERAFIKADTTLDPQTASCQLSALYAGQKQLLYEMKPIEATLGTSTGEEIGFVSQADLDAAPGPGGSVIIDPARRTTPPGESPSSSDTQGRLILTPLTSVPWSADELLGVEFQSDGVLSIGVEVQSGGQAFFRYYPATGIGPRNLVLLSPVGFPNGAGIASVEKLTLYFYTSNQTGIVTMKPNRLLVFRRPMELYQYFRSGDIQFVTQ